MATDIIVRLTDTACAVLITKGGADAEKLLRSHPIAGLSIAAAATLAQAMVRDVLLQLEAGDTLVVTAQQPTVSELTDDPGVYARDGDTTLSGTYPGPDGHTIYALLNAETTAAATTTAAGGFWTLTFPALAEDDTVAVFAVADPPGVAATPESITVQAAPEEP